MATNETRITDRDLDDMSSLLYAKKYGRLVDPEQRARTVELCLRTVQVTVLEEIRDTLREPLNVYTSPSH